VPLSGRFERPVGVLQVADKVQGDFTDADEAILVQLAQMASVAVEKAELYHREHLIAETLQRSLLPAALPEIPGMQLASRYMPGGAGSEVGGDWYDAIPLEDGRVALTIGDVVGRGVTAAAIMGQLRIAMRAYCLQGLGPIEVMEGLNRLGQDFDDDHFATTIVMDIDPATMELCFANAGPPCRRCSSGPDGSSELLEGGLGPPLNVPGPGARRRRTNDRRAGAAPCSSTPTGWSRSGASPSTSGCAACRTSSRRARAARADVRRGAREARRCRQGRRRRGARRPYRWPRVDESADE
jgi:hypothetical protein